MARARGAHAAAPPGRRPGTVVSPARRCAYTVVRRVFEQGAYADRALAGEAERAALDPRERAFATRLTYGTVQRWGTITALLERLAGRPADGLDPPLRAAVALGVFQIVFLDGVAAHAAVDQTVELAKEAGAGAAALANAVLRRATREAPRLLGAMGEGTPAEAALRHSVPEWLARLWWEALGPADARALLARINEPAESALRANALVLTADEVVRLLAAHRVRARRALDPPEGVVLEGAFDARGSALWATGAVMPQSRASMAVARVVAPRPRQRVLDLCAAPGGKTTHLAALMGDAGEVVAVERHAGRAEALRRTCRRLRARSVRVEVADARALGGGARDFDRILVDPPCSGLGTLQSRPDLRWRASPEGIERLVGEQDAILDAAAGHLRPGGVLVYSTCTISARENEERIGGFLDRHPDFAADDLQVERPAWRHPTVPRHLQLLPHRDGTDGFFIVRLRRSDA